MTAGGRIGLYGLLCKFGVGMGIFSVSVVIAVKNETVYVEQALRSVLVQEGVDFEVIVVDDGSTDNTYEILERLQSSYDNLRLVRNPKRGKCSAFNYGVSLSSGTYVCIYAGDDIMPQGSLQARFNKVRDYPVDAEVVGLCKLITMSEDKKFDGHLVPKRAGKGGLTGVSYMMSRPVVAKIFPVPEALPNEDTWMELAITHFDSWTLVHSDIIGCQWRVHGGNSINMQVDFAEYNRKLTPRMAAIALFYSAHGHDLSEASRLSLTRKVKCEELRKEGNVVGLLLCDVSFVNRLRAISAANGFFYTVRKMMYGLLSGW